MIPKGGESRHFEVSPSERKAAKRVKKSANTVAQKSSKNGLGLLTHEVFPLGWVFSAASLSTWVSTKFMSHA